MVIFDRILIICFAMIFVKFSSGSLHQNDTNIEKQSNCNATLKPAPFEADLNNATDKNSTLERGVQPGGIITPVDFYERIMQHLEDQKLSPRDLIGPTEVFMMATMMFDKLYEAYIEKFPPSNATLVVKINPEEVPTCENFYNNLTSFVRTEYQVADQNEPMKLVMIAREMYNSMYDVYKQGSKSKNSTNTTETEQLS